MDYVNESITQVAGIYELKGAGEILPSGREGIFLLRE
jgi:hypothetical protein